jgi:hypothetical protein
VQPRCLCEAHSEDGLGGGTDGRDYPVSLVVLVTYASVLIGMVYRCDSGSRHYSRVCSCSVP